MFSVAIGWPGSEGDPALALVTTQWSWAELCTCSGALLVCAAIVRVLLDSQILKD